MRLRTVALLLAASARILSARSPVAATPDTTTDPYLWLEAQRGDSALAWVARQNERTRGVHERARTSALEFTYFARRLLDTLPVTPPVATPAPR